MSQKTFNFSSKEQNTTPMMSQYLAIKADYKDSILFYRMGDFYEMFFEDAISAAKLLNIALTKRGKKDDQDIPMCGVPFHSCDSYIQKLISNGYKVAICEQMESPEEAKKRGYKAVVRREVVRVITPGTIVEDTLLEGKTANYLISISVINHQLAVAAIDISTGQFFTINTQINSLNSVVSSLNPREILITDSLFNNEDIKRILHDWQRNITIYTKAFFDLNKTTNKLKAFYQVSTIESFGELSAAQISSCGAILEYISITQKNNVPSLNPPKIIKNEYFMVIDSSTRKNLELTNSITDQQSNTLLNVIDKTITNTGGRLLRQYLSLPLVDPNIINARLESVDFFYQHEKLMHEIREILKNFTDLERAINRISLNHGGPRDLLSIKNGLLVCKNLINHFQSANISLLPQLKNNLSYLTGFDNIINELSNALKDDVPLLARDGNFIKDTYNSELDELFTIKRNSKLKFQELKHKYINITSVNNLKISYNNVIGYYIEVTSANMNKLNNDLFIHRQSLANSIRFTTEELKKLEQDSLNINEAIINAEIEIYEKLIYILMAEKERIIVASNNIAQIDVFVSLALIAKEQNYIKPIIDNSNKFNIEEGRHPVVNYVLSLNNETFVTNNCNLSDRQKIWLITGPNMAGKSTFLRQNAIIAIMAQMGSFVPAKHAHIGVIDRVFSRVGASDDLAQGRSTFMVEMVETATILNQATSKSLVILDEIGRGTSTYDGVSIAWSCLEYIHNKISCRGLFATHYHELTELENNLNELKCYSFLVKEWEDKVILLHKVMEGPSDKSYGIHVAKIAGIPIEVIDQANKILKTLKSQTNSNTIDNIEEVQINNSDKVKEYINKININEVNPIEALNHLANIKNMIT